MNKPSKLRTARARLSLADLKDLFGQPPVLSSENPRAYDEITVQLIESLDPKDIVEMIFIRQVIDCTWEIMRCTRHKTLTIERKFRQQREVQAKLAKARKERREALSRERAERAASVPTTERERMFDLQDEVFGAVGEIDAILDRPVDELEHGAALEAAMNQYREIDLRLGAAIARRDEALLMLERYRDGLGEWLRRASDKILDGGLKDHLGRPWEAVIDEHDPLYRVMLEMEEQNCKDLDPTSKCGTSSDTKPELPSQKAARGEQPKPILTSVPHEELQTEVESGAEQTATDQRDDKQSKLTENYIPHGAGQRAVESKAQHQDPDQHPTAGKSDKNVDENDNDYDD